MNLHPRIVVIVLALVIGALVAVFPFVPADTSWDNYRESRRVMTPGGGVYRFYEKNDDSQ